MFHLRQDLSGPTPTGPGVITRVVVARKIAGWKLPRTSMVIVQSQPHLFQVVGTLGAGSSFPNALHRRNQQTHQNRNDGNHHQQFNQGKCETASKRDRGHY